jgi:hypothetical protein
MTFELTDEMLAKWPPDAQALIRLLLARVAELEVQVAELRGQLAEARGKTPQNSSQPPSTTHPHAKPPSVKPKSKRSRGGQPGHDKHDRALIPVESCRDVVPCVPRECRRCGRKLSGRDPAPLRHQVTELAGIEPTNNAAERALRHAVIWRKLSFGTQSAAGSRFVERLLTVIETSRRQDRNVFDWLTQAVQAKLRRESAPSLLATV